MHAWESIQKVLDHIENNIDEAHSPEELAKVAALSPFYFQRLFSRLVKRPVGEYIKLRKLARACGALNNKSRRILDIAVEHGFSGHGVFTKAFKEAYGITPEAYRERPVMLNQFDKPDLLLNYTLIEEGVPLVSDGLVLEFNRKTLEHPVCFMGVTGVVPIEGQMPLGEATGIDMPGAVWQRFHTEKHLIPKLAGGRELGVAYLDGAPKGCFIYFAGAEVKRGTEDVRFKIWDLPAGEYAVCGFEAENFEQLVTVAINKAVKYGCLWLKKHGITMKEYSPELYYDSSPDATYMELWFPIAENR